MEDAVWEPFEQNASQAVMYDLIPLRPVLDAPHGGINRLQELLGGSG